MHGAAEDQVKARDACRRLVSVHVWLAQAFDVEGTDALAQQRAGRRIGAQLHGRGGLRLHAQLHAGDAPVGEVDVLEVHVAAGGDGDRLAEAGVVAVFLGRARLAVVVLALDLDERVPAGHRALEPEDDERRPLPVQREGRAERGVDGLLADRLGERQVLRLAHRLPLRLGRVRGLALADPDAVRVAVRLVDEELRDEDLLPRERGGQVAHVHGHAVGARGLDRAVVVVDEDLELVARWRTWWPDASTPSLPVPPPDIRRFGPR